MSERKRGRPRKVGLWTYFLATGNPSSLVTKTFDTDTEVKRAAQKFFASFEEHCRRYDNANYERLAGIRAELDALRDTDNDWSFNRGPFEHATVDNPLTWSLTFDWNVTATCKIWKVKR